MAEKGQSPSSGLQLQLSVNDQCRSIADPRRNNFHVASTNPLRAPPNTVIACLPPPHLDFRQVTRATLSGSFLGSGDRLRPLTPIHTKTNSGGAVSETMARRSFPAATVRQLRRCLLVPGLAGDPAVRAILL